MMKPVNSITVIEPENEGEAVMNGEEEGGEQQPLLLSGHSGQQQNYGIDSLTVNNFSFASKFNKQHSLPVMVNQTPATADATRSILPLSSSLSSNSMPSPLFYNHIRINSDSQRGSCNNFISFKKLLQFTGPGLLISVAYLDPGNLDVDIQSGAIAGYKLLWVLMYSSIAGYLIQYLSVKLGSVTGYHLAEICRREYSPFMRLFLWMMLEISIIASDIQQVIGSALALTILTNGYIPMWGAILITTLDVLIFLLFETKGIRVIEIIFAAFITILGGCFLYMYIRVGPDQVKILEGIAIPWCSGCSGAEIKQLIGILGSIVMPHNIYFHSCLVLSRDFERSDHAVREAKKYYAIESGFALLVAFVINLFVTSVSAKSFNGTPEAQNVTIFNTAEFINSQYGVAAKIIWAIGLLSAGQCSTISGTYAGQFIMQGLTRINLTKLMRILVTRLVSIVPCLLVTILAYDNLAHLSLWCNIISSIQLPFALLPILHFTSSRRIMGPFKNNLLTRIVCYLITLVILSLNIYFIIEFILKTRLLVTYILGSIFVIYSILVSIFLIGVNNVYRIKLLFRRLFCAYNPDEMDELLRTNPVYRRPTTERTGTSTQQHTAESVDPAVSASVQATVGLGASPLPLPPYLDRYRSILETSSSNTLLRHPPSINDDQDDDYSYTPII